MDFIIKNKLDLLHFSCDKNNIIYYYDINKNLCKNDIILSKDGIYSVVNNKNKIYIITLNPDNEVVYILKEKDVYKKFILTRINEQLI